MKAPPMNAKQRRFFNLYFGRDDRLAGNATRCYKAAYGLQDDRSAQVSASRLLKKPEFADWLAALEAEAMQELQVNAEFVKSHNVRILQQAMGDEPVTSTTITVDDLGNERIEHSERYESDHSIALKALQLLGQHKDVQAFTQVVEHSHTHRLEQRLSAKSKVIEHKAAQVQGSDRPAALESPSSQRVINENQGAAPGNVPGEGVPATRAENTKRGCINEEVNESHDEKSEKKSFESEGATAA